MNTIWEQFLCILKDEVGNNVVETWFKAVALFRVDQTSKRVFLVAPNLFVKEWITQNYLPIITKQLSRLLNTNPLAVSILVNADLQNLETPVPQRQNGTEQNEQNRFRPASVVSELAPGEVKNKFLNAEYQFENFIIGPHNTFACAAAQAVTDQLGTLYNPLFIYGSSGLGKTHLLHAIGNKIQGRSREPVVLYQPAKTFVDEFILAIRHNEVPKFQKKYQKISVLLIDDIQFMANKEQTQEAFFHIFNALYDARKQIVFTSDAYPHALEGVAERLRSRLASGLIADIHVPPLETKMAIIKKKAEGHKVVIADEVVHFLALHAGNSVRELQGALTRLIACSTLTKTSISLESAKQIFQNSVLDEKGKKTLDAPGILKIVAQYYDFSADALCSRERHKKLVRARHVAMFLVQKLTQNSLRDIATLFDAKSHATVKHALSSVERARGENQVIAGQIKELETMLR